VFRRDILMLSSNIVTSIDKNWNGPVASGQWLEEEVRGIRRNMGKHEEPSLTRRVVWGKKSLADASG